MFIIKRLILKHMLPLQKCRGIFQGGLFKVGDNFSKATKIIFFQRRENHGIYEVSVRHKRYYRLTSGILEYEIGE